nr:unnamed protein product [Callosobruchus analis]
MVKPARSNRNITTENWYSLVELCNELEKQKLIFVDILKKTKTSIPPEFLPNRYRLACSSLFVFTSNTTTVSHVPRKNKSVILLSSKGQGCTMMTSILSTKQSDVELFYNTTKVGVDELDQKCANYSTFRRTRRWPMVIFHMMLNVTGVNSRILYQFSPFGKDIKRFKFLKSLGISLCEAQVKARISNPKPRQLRSAAANMFKIPVDMPSIPQENVSISKRKRCSICPGKKIERQVPVGSCVKNLFVYNMSKNLSGLYLKYIFFSKKFNEA